MENQQKSPIVVPASRGIAWLLQSLGLIRMQAGRLLFIAVFLQIILGLTSIPVIGLLIIISVPGFSAGILEAFDVTRRGGLPGINLLFRPMVTGTHTARLILMGVLVFIVGVLSISLLLAGSEGLLNPELLARIEQGDVEAITQLDLEALRKLAMAFLVGLAISGTLSYFTIPLIWFGNRKLGTALAVGISALLINWKAFLVLTLGLVVSLIPVLLLTGMLLGLAGSGGVVSFIVMGVIMILILAYQMMIFGTQYCAYRDIFGIESAPEPPQQDKDGQFVA